MLCTDKQTYELERPVMRREHVPDNGLVVLHPCHKPLDGGWVQPTCRIHTLSLIHYPVIFPTPWCNGWNVKIMAAEKFGLWFISSFGWLLGSTMCSAFLTLMGNCTRFNS